MAKSKRKTKKREKTRSTGGGKIRIIEKTMNNSSRKGKYYYIKEKGKRPAYYKVKEGLSIDHYLEAYKGKLKIKKKGVVQEGKKAEKYIKKIGKGVKIEDLISKGITKVDINDIRGMSRRRLHTAYSSLLSPLVLDKGLLRILALEENVNKFKHRLQTKVTISSQDGEVEIYLKAFGKTLSQVQSDLSGIAKKGQLNERDLKEIKKRGYSFDGLPKGTDITPYKDKVITHRVGKIKAKVIFTKEK